MKKFLTLLGLCLLCTLVPAQERAQPYFVSGVLQKEGPSPTIKLVQVVVVTTSAENAKLILLAKTGKDFPGYLLLDAIASDLEQIYKPASDMAPSQQRQRANASDV